MTQSALGAAVGYSAAWVSRVENNKIVPPWLTLTRIATVLDISYDELGIAAVHGDPGARHAAPLDHWATRVSSGPVAADEEDDDVLRRNFLTSTIGVGAVLLTGTTDAKSSNRALACAGPVLESALFEPLDAEPRPLEKVAHALRALRREFDQARYQTLGRKLPLIIATAEASRDNLTGHQREVAHVIVARSYVLASELAVKEHSEVAWVTADRALTAARASGQAGPIGEAARVLAITMRRSGRGRAAVDLLSRTALALGAERDHPARRAQAVRTSLLLTAAYTAAHIGARTDALDLADEAERCALRLGADPDTGLFTVTASPRQCALYRIGIHTTLGTPDEAVDHVRNLDPESFPTVERRARCYLDTARMWHQLGDHRRTFTALRSIERHAPEEVRRPSVRALTAGLAYAPVSIPGVKEFAERTGATSD